MTEVSTLLDQRGIPVLACANVAVDLRRDGERVAVAIDGREARVVGDPRTAATIIESWVRTDVGDPLLGARPVVAIAETPPPSSPVGVSDGIVKVPATWRGVQVFALGQTAVASDGTGWLGTEIGACVALGPVCAAARVRIAQVAGGPGPFEQMLDRRGVELLLGGDIPMSLGKLTLSPGFSGGVGAVVTHVADTEGRHMGNEIGGLRADVHASLTYPLSHRFAAEIAVSFDFTQQTHVENYTPEVTFPDVPLFLARIALGLRYGGL
ncbi:MAG TPA: hypothetical protein VGO00_00910 [Kofleriaceae bacterium]|nr:hypothetical protein [Kofleriaceae bacterium]